MPTGSAFPLQPSGQLLIILVQVFFGCPHRVPHPVVWDDLCAKISSLYSDASEPVAGPSYRNQCAIDYASITALSTEFIMIATAYDIVNIYEETGSQSIVYGPPSPQNLSDKELQLIRVLPYRLLVSNMAPWESVPRYQ